MWQTDLKGTQKTPRSRVIIDWKSKWSEDGALIRIEYQCCHELDPDNDMVRLDSHSDQHDFHIHVDGERLEEFPNDFDSGLRRLKEICETKWGMKFEEVEDE